MRVQLPFYKKLESKPDSYLFRKLVILSIRNNILKKLHLIHSNLQSNKVNNNLVIFLFLIGYYVLYIFFNILIRIKQVFFSRYLCLSHNSNFLCKVIAKFQKNINIYSFTAKITKYVFSIHALIYLFIIPSLIVYYSLTTILLLLLALFKK